MKTRVYAAFVVSCEPIELKKLREQNPGITHYITEELTLSTGADREHWETAKDIGQNYGYESLVIDGCGRTMVATVLDWLKNLFSSKAYIPDEIKGK